MLLPKRIALIAAVGAAALAAEPGRAKAQTMSSEVPPLGTRVRIYLGGTIPSVGTLVDRTSDRLVVGWRDGQRDTLAIASVSRLDVSQGSRRHVRRGAMIGLVAGTIVGVLKMADADASHTRLEKFQTCGDSCDPIERSTSEQGNGKFVPMGIALGMTVGALCGLIATEDWHPVATSRGELRVGVAPVVSSRRVSLALSAPF